MKDNSISISTYTQTHKYSVSTLRCTLVLLLSNSRHCFLLKIQTRLPSLKTTIPFTEKSTGLVR